MEFVQNTIKKGIKIYYVSVVEEILKEKRVIMIKNKNFKKNNSMIQ
jgi:hypothetical protein